jgi:kynurenine formamidase
MNVHLGISSPGIGVDAASWLIAREPMLVGADNFAVEVFPNPDRRVYVPVHQLAITTNGIHLLENMKLDELAAKRA